MEQTIDVSMGPHMGSPISVIFQKKGLQLGDTKFLGSCNGFVAIEEEIANHD